jgi:hypothetical protein
MVTQCPDFQSERAKNVAFSIRRANGYDDPGSRSGTLMPGLNGGTMAQQINTVRLGQFARPEAN